MKTYAESEGHAVFNWNAFLENAHLVGSAEQDNARTLSGSWVTCACGNQSNFIPRNWEGVPLDDELEGLGVVFSDHINSGYWNSSKKVLAQIEEKSAFIINQLSNEYK